MKQPSPLSVVRAATHSSQMTLERTCVCKTDYMNIAIYTTSDNGLISKVSFFYIPVILSFVAVVPSKATEDETDSCDEDSTVSFVVASVAAQKFSTNTQHCYEMYTKSGSPQK